MKTPKALTRAIVIAATILMALASFAGDGSQADISAPRAVLRGNLLHASPSGTNVASGFFAGTVQVAIPFVGIVDMNVSAAAEGEIQGSTGGFVGLEWMLKQGRFGLEVDFTYAPGIVTTSSTVNGFGPVTNDFDGYMVLFGANYHFKPGQKTDFYAGLVLSPGVQMTNDNLEPTMSFGYGLNLGVDHTLNSRWVLNANFRYVDFGEVEDFKLVEHGVFDLSGAGFNSDAGYLIVMQGAGDLVLLGITAGVGYRF